MEVCRIKSHLEFSFVFKFIEFLHLKFPLQYLSQNIWQTISEVHLKLLYFTLNFVGNLQSSLSTMFWDFHDLSRIPGSFTRWKHLIVCKSNQQNGLDRSRLQYLFLGLAMSSWWHWLNCIRVCLSFSFNLLIVSLSFKSSRISATCLSCKICYILAFKKFLPGKIYF